jgi:hypothetical protein
MKKDGDYGEGKSIEHKIYVPSKLFSESFIFYDVLMMNFFPSTFKSYALCMTWFPFFYFLSEICSTRHSVHVSPNKK